jgi:hypothetical protein
MSSTTPMTMVGNFSALLTPTLQMQLLLGWKKWSRMIHLCSSWQIFHLVGMLGVRRHLLPGSGRRIPEITHNTPLL